MKLSDNAMRRLKDMLLRDEAYRRYPYFDTTGNKTVGIGRNLTTRGIDSDEIKLLGCASADEARKHINEKGLSLDEAMYFLQNDIQIALDDVQKAVPNFNSLSESRKICLANMVFNLGLPSFLTFKKMIRAITAGDDAQVVKEMLQSKWHDDVGARADRIASLWAGG